MKRMIVKIKKKKNDKKMNIVDKDGNINIDEDDD